MAGRPSAPYHVGTHVYAVNPATGKISVARIADLAWRGTAWEACLLVGAQEPFWAPAQEVHRAELGFLIRIDASELPQGWWQSVECPTCGAAPGEFCMYNDTRAAHTRHKARDEAVWEAAKRRALSPDVTGTPGTPPRRRKPRT